MPASTAAAASCPASLQALIDGTPSGGTLTAPPCTYRESITIRRALTLHAAGATIDGENTRTRGVTVTGNDVTIDGLTVTRIKGDDHVGAVNLEGGDRFTFKNGVARDSRSVCVALHGGSGARILDSELTGCGKEGYFLNNMSDSVFARNKIHHNNMALAYDWFMEAGGGKTMASNKITFDSNEVAWNRGPGIWFDNAATNAVITGNRVHHNDREGIFFEISSGAKISGNSVWNNGHSYAPWGWGAGISISSSDGAAVSGNTVAWNARGISVISQGRQLSPHDHNTVVGNVVVSAGGDRVTGWYDDHGGSLFSSGNANGGSSNRYWIGAKEPTNYRFEWNGGRTTIAAFNATPGEEGASYLSTAERDDALGAAGIPNEDGVVPPAPTPRDGDPRFTTSTARIGTTSVPAKVVWSKVAVASAYQLQLQRDGGTWATIGLASPKSLSAGVTLATGHSYRARLRLKTSAASWGAWSESAVVQARRYQETTSALGYSGGTWRRSTSTGASGGSVRHTSTRDAKASFTFTGRSVAWIAPVGRTRGSARVYVDGTYRSTVSLYRSSTSSRQVLYRMSWATSGKHTVVIKAVGTSGHPRVDVDAFTVID
jgi:parallel beta-helix repeat protein